MLSSTASRRALSLVVLVLTLTSCSRKDAEREAAPASETRELRVGIAIGSPVHAVAWVGEEAGLFKAQGLQTQIEVMGGSAAAMRTLVGGGVDVALAGGDAMLKASAAGAELIAIGTLVNRFYHRLVVHEDIKQPEDLRGKTIGLPFLGGPQDMAVKYALSKWGLRYNEDVKVASLGKEFNLLAALSRGDIQAATSDAPDSKLRELGLSVLLDLRQESAPFPYIAVITRRELLTQRRSDLAGFMRGLCAATLHYKAALRADAAQREAVLATLGSRLRAKPGPVLLERFQDFGPSLLNFPPRIDAQAFDSVRKQMDDSKAVLVKGGEASLFEASILEEARGPCLVGN